ncbi:GTP pyrophosphokinase family protein [Micromonospora sp. NPDC000316]|uniref:GTP pyrophosphokinase n=1 Tax=Micromonospora sp. NPDC000316 TaxID=3364216 RepID=UPI0036916E89
MSSETGAVTPIDDSEWEDLTGLAGSLGPKAREWIKELIDDAGMHLHSVEARVKDRADAERKILDKGVGEYSLENMTDVLGVRVITYFPDEIDSVASIIEREFGVDHENSVDKRALLDPDRFGYLSLHYVVRVRQDLCSRRDFEKYCDFKFEIQIRTILQHAWAEIEHDLGYKSKEDLPVDVRRRFSRLAGLLELADSEFEHIRNDLSEHRLAVGLAVRESPLGVPIDRDSILAYIAESGRLARLDLELTELYGGATVAAPSPDYASRLAAFLHRYGFENIGQLDEILEEKYSLLIAFIEQHQTKPRKSIPKGAALQYLLVLEATYRDGSEGQELLTEIKFPFPYETARKRRLVAERDSQER